MLKQLAPYIVIFALIMVYIDSCQSNSHREKSLLDNLAIARDSVKHFKGKNSELVNQVKVMTLTVDDLGKQGAALGLVNSDLKRQVGNLSNLVSYYKGKITVKQEIVTKAKDSVEVTVDAKNDTIKKERVKVFAYDNGFLKLDQVFNPATGFMTTKYGYQTGFELTVYKKADFKFNPFSKRRLYADFRLKDQNARLAEATSVLIEPPPKKFYERTWFHLVAGAVGGIWLSSRF